MPRGRRRIGLYVRSPSPFFRAWCGLRAVVDPLDGRARYEQGARRARVELEAMEAMVAERIDRLTDDWLDEVEKDERRGTEGQEAPGG